MIPIVGPSYRLDVRKADVQRSVNLYPVIVESGTGKSPAYLKSLDGLTQLASLGAEIRGFKAANGRLFVVAGSELIELDGSFTPTVLGTIGTNSGPVDFAYGITQLVLVDGPNGYAMDLATNVISPIGANFYGSARVGFIDGYFVFIRPGTDQFYWSAINDATVLDALDFATAEGAPDNLVSLVVDHRELWLFGQDTTEVWVSTGSEAVFERNAGAFIEHGCAAALTAQKLDNSVFWLGRDERGGGIVWRAQGYSPVRISTHAVEESLQTGTDISQASAFTYQKDGHAFYVLQVPGLDTTWAYDVSAQAWHERAELVNGAFAPHRGTCHAYAFDRHILGDADGNVYELDREAYTNAGDVLVRDRTSPHLATPNYDRIQFGRLEVDCIVGAGKELGAEPQLMMRYSNDGGISFSGWRQTGLGAIGKTLTRARFLRCGSARDRVWQIRFTDNAPFAIVGATVS